MAPLLGGATTARPLGAFSGVRPGTATNIATATSTTWTVTPFAGVIDGEALAIAGPYGYAFDANVTGSVTAAAGSARVDRLDVQVSDPAESDGSSVPGIAVVYNAGVPGSGVPVAAPARSHPLALINVPLSGGGSPTVTWNATYSIGAGGILPIASTALAAATYPGQYIDDPSLGLMHSNGTSWLTVSPVTTIVPGTPTSTGGTASTSANGEVTFSGATSDLLVPGVFSATGITEIEIEMLTSSGAANCTWGLVTAGGTRLITGYTNNLAQYTTSAAAVSTAAGSTTAWQNLRMNGTTGGHGFFRVARAASTTRKSMHGNNIDGAVFDTGAGWNSSTVAHTGVWFTFGGSTATGVVRFRLISNQS